MSARPYKNILLPIDLGHESSWQWALPSAVDIARMHGGMLHVLTVIPSFGMPVVGSFFPKDFEDRARKEAEKALAEFIREHVPDDIEVDGYVAVGTIYDEIIHAADRIGCDLIVLASHRPEMKDYLLGTNAARVVRHARQSVLVVRF